MATTATKNKYGKAEDKIILTALAKSPDNISEALRIAKEELKKQRGIEATVNQLSSRYYSYIVPHYIEGDEEIDLDVNGKNHAYLSAGSFREVKDEIEEEEDGYQGETKLDLIKELTDDLEWKDRKALWTYLFQTL